MLTYDEGVRLANLIISSFAALAGFTSVVLVHRSNRLSRESTDRLETSRAQAATQLEQVRSELRNHSFRQEVQYSKLHERRATVLAEVYANVEAVHRLCRESRQIFAPEGQVAESTGRAREVQRVLEAHFSKHRIYFAPQEADLVDQAVSALRKVVQGLPGHPPERDFLNTMLTEQPYKESPTGLAHDLLESVKPVQEALARAFREILGVPTGPP